MIAYKFRSTNNFDFLIDILLNKRLYCADYRDLNDVFEADIRTGVDTGREKEFIKKMKHYQELLRTYRVCSLSKTADNHQLWAYYANGHTGLAIIVDLAETDDNVFEIEYSNNLLFFSKMIDDYQNPKNIIKPLLQKRTSWKHEEEIRIITKEPYFDLKKRIRGVIAGARMNSTTQIALNILCEKIGIPLYRAVITDRSISNVSYQNNYEHHIRE